MQGTQVRFLVQEDPTCHGAAKPVCHSCWAGTLELCATATGPVCCNYWSPHTWSPGSATREGTTVRSPGLQLEKAWVQQWSLNKAKNNNQIKSLKNKIYWKNFTVTWRLLKVLIQSCSFKRIWDSVKNFAFTSCSCLGWRVAGIPVSTGGLFHSFLLVTIILN